MPSLRSSIIPALPAWPLVVGLLLATAGLVVGQIMASRPRFPPAAPRRLTGWPVFGCLDFFRSRCDFLRRGRALDPSGQFSFYYGPHPIVAVSGSAARSSFYNARGLDLSAGFAGLFAAVPIVGNIKDSVDSMAPFLGMLRLIYQMTHRTIGCDDVADDAKLLDDTLATFDRLDDSSALEVMFPNLVTPNKLKKAMAGLRLHRVFAKIVRDRRRTGRKATDAMQMLVDQGLSEAAVSMTMISSLFAGLINSTFNAAWVLCFLADDAAWYGRVQAEVDGVVSKHRSNEDRTAADTLARLSLAQWESCFPVIGVCLRETIRLSGRGASMRKNVSGKDIQIGDTGQVIPANAYAICGFEDAHMDDTLYADPHAWDPDRFLPGREEGKAPHAYIGWGSGLHPCLGIRLAKLEIAVSTALFFVRFGFARCDKAGRDTAEPLPSVDRRGIGEKWPERDIFLRCQPRA